MLILAVAIPLSIRPCRHRTVPIAPSALPSLTLSIPRCRCGDAAITPPPPSSRHLHPHCGSPTLSALIVLHTAPVMIMTTAHSIECVIFVFFFFSSLLANMPLLQVPTLACKHVETASAPLARPLSPPPSRARSHPRRRAPTLTLTLAS
jgi:hypothetical protein